MSSEFHWSNERSLHLIKLFKSKEFLWNPRHPDHRNRNRRTEAMSEMADEFGIERSEIERKLKNLTCHYFREMKKCDESVSSGKNAYKTKWFAYRALEFLKLKFASVVYHDEATTPEEQSEFEPIQETESIVQQPPVKRKNLSTHTNKPDDCETFGQYIASKLRRMDDITKATVQHHINNIIYQAEVGSYSRDSNVYLNTYYGSPKSDASVKTEDDDDDNVNDVDNKEDVMNYLMIDNDG